MDEKTMQEHWQKARGICRENEQRGSVEFPTSLEFLDNLTGGFRRGEVWIVAGKTGGGKTSLALQMAKSFADDTSHSILFLSLEMKGWELALRMYSEMEGQNYFGLLNGKITFNPNGVHSFEEYLTNIDFEIIEYGYRFNDIERVIAKLYAKKKPDVIFLDFIQLIEWRSFGEQRLAIMEYIRKIKEMAKKMDIGFVLVSQLRRLPSGADYDRPPDMIDLYGSGSLEQISDKVILIYKMTKEGEEPLYYINLAKNRQGQTGKERVIFEGEFYRFKDLISEPQVEKVKNEFQGTLL